MRDRTLAISFAALAALAFTVLTPATSAWAQKKDTIRVVYIPVITWLPALVAKDDGIFEKHGLDVQFTKAATIVNLPAALGKQFDMVPTTAPDLLNAAANGLNIAAVAGETVETSHNKSYQVMVRADSNIKTYKDLVGKRVLGPGVGSVMHVALLYAIKKQGGDPSKVIGLEAPFPAMADQLKAGRVDAVEQLEPFVGGMLAGGFRTLGAPLLEVAVLDRRRGLGARASRRAEKVGRLAGRRPQGRQDRRETRARDPREILRFAAEDRRSDSAAGLRFRYHHRAARGLAEGDGRAGLSGR
jgi:ABC-type amino acid transport substrate-binding protein